MGGGNSRFKVLKPSESLWLFGSAGGKPCIIEYNAKAKKLSAPKSIPTGMELYENCRAVWINDDYIFVSGGVDYAKKTVSKKCYLYRPKLGSAIELPDLTVGRFGHALAVMGSNVFAIGGRSVEGQKDIFLDSVERMDLTEVLKFYDPKKKVEKPKDNKVAPTDPKASQTLPGSLVKSSVASKWEAGPALNVGRVDHSVFQYKDKFVVFGGLDVHGNRLEAVETCTKDNKQKWTLEKVEYGLGSEGHTLHKGNEQEVLFFGGQDDFHRNKFWGSFKLYNDVNDTTYSVEGNIPPVNHPKVVYWKDGFHVLTQDDKSKQIVAHIINGNTKKVKANGVTDTTGGFKGDLTTFGQSHRHISVSGGAKKVVKPQSASWKEATDGPQVLHIFGNDNHPCYLYFDRATKNVSNRGLPLGFRQFSNSASARLNASTILLIGGASYDESPTEPNYISDLIYHLDVSRDLGWRASIDLPIPVANASAVKIADDKLLISGGRTFNSQLQTIVSNKCFIVSVQGTNYKVEATGDLSVARFDHASVCHGTDVWVFGGKDANGKALNSVEKWSTSSGKWETSKLVLPKAASKLGAYRTPGKDEIVIVGGLGDNKAKIGDVAILDIKAGTLSTKGQLKEAKDDILVWQDKKGKIGVYGDAKTNGEKLEQSPTKKPGDVQVKATKDGDTAKLAKAFEEYFEKNSSDIVLIS